MLHIEVVSECLFCQGNHNLERCFKFRDKSFEERRKFLMDKRLCANFPKANLFARRCKLFRARLFSACGTRHHSLLHPPQLRVIEEVSQPVNEIRGESQDQSSMVNVDGAVSVEGQCAAIGSG